MDAESFNRLSADSESTAIVSITVVSFTEGASENITGRCFSEVTCAQIVMIGSRNRISNILYIFILSLFYLLKETLFVDGLHTDGLSPSILDEDIPHRKETMGDNLRIGDITHMDDNRFRETSAHDLQLVMLEDIRRMQKSLHHHHDDDDQKEGHQEMRYSWGPQYPDGKEDQQCRHQERHR